MPVYLPGLTFGGLGYGGASYGYSPYGSGVYPRLPVPVDGGYGGAAYGLTSYGSVDITPPRVTGVNPLDGYRIEVFFSEPLADDAALVAAINYTFAATYGVPITSVSVAKGTSSGPGYSSVIVTHTGTTLGGQYVLTVDPAVTDVAGNPIGPPPVNTGVFYALGDTATVQVSLPSPDDGRTVQLDFKNSLGSPQDLLTEAEFTPGVEDPATYEVTTAYPVAPTVSSATQDSGLLSRVFLDVHPMTSAVYDLLVGPSRAIQYDGTLLPDDDPDLSGVEVNPGSGTSVATPSDGLVLSTAGSMSYGWSFGDTSGRMAPGTTYRADFAFDLTGTTIAPAVLNSTLGTFSVSDGAIQIDVGLADSAGVKILTIASGALSASVLASWDTPGQHTVSLVRNQRGSFYTVLFDEEPVYSFAVGAATGPAVYAAGTAVVLGPAHTVSLFKLLDVGLTATTTLFTSAWNFIHGLATSFTGSAVLTRDRIKTKYGPLVRGWGDATPATKEDVEVRLDGTPVGIAGVNPYIGEVYPEIPIPLAAAGTFTVDVDYIWFRNPAMELVGLNIPGLALNVWDRAVGHTAGASSPVPADSLGTAKTNLFPMGVVLGPYDRPSPKRVGHSYIGFQKNGYSALLNEPTTLLLNQNPHAISVGGLTAEALRSTGMFNGQTTPQTAGTPWVLFGVDSGSVLGDGTYEIVDASSGPFGIGTAAIYTRDVDLSLDTVVTEAGRFRIEGATPDGVFTGVGLGVHDGAHLVLVGALLIDGVQHLGVLLDAAKTHLEEGWQIGPVANAVGTSQTTIRVRYEDFPSGIQPGDRFRIPEGPQAGVYTIAECGLNLDESGTFVAITLDPSSPLPSDVQAYNDDDFQIVFETPWDQNLVSVRLYADFPAGSVAVYLGGGISTLLTELGDVPAFPAQSALLIPASDKGMAFFGSLSRRAMSQSVWDLAQYASDPSLITRTVQGITALTEMNVVPTEDPNDPWYIVGGFGTGTVDSTGDRLLLKATSAYPTGDPDTEFSYERVEPYLTPKVITDAEATFFVESGILGAGDAEYRVRDTVREAVLRTLLIVDDPVNGNRLSPVRPNVSLAGLQSPTDAGWTPSLGSTAPDPFVRGQTLEFTKATGQVGSWSSSASTTTLVSDEGVILDGRFSVQSATMGSEGIGFALGASVRLPGGGSPAQERTVYLTLSTGALDLRDRAGAVIASVPFAWDDGAFHDYRLLCDPVADIVVIVVDDTVLGSTPLSGFSAATVSGDTYLTGHLAFTGTGQCAVTLDSLHVVPLRTVPLAGTTLVRTFGLLIRGGDPDTLDAYKVPRSDGLPVPNSDPAATFVDMDWRTACCVRLLLDPDWGASFYRPDLPLPPGATGSYATETTDPSAAWATLEYGDLPTASVPRGTVTFGSLDPRSISQQRWDNVRYRIRGDVDGFGIAPQNMVLNRAFTLTSGEFNNDTIPEIKTVVSRTPFSVYVPDSAIYADRVFVVQVDGAVVPDTSYTFDKDTQFIQFASTAPLPSAQHPVTVTFAAGTPVTKTYLCDQPLDGTITVLNEGTPPIPMSRDVPSTTTVTAGSVINDPDDVLDSAESMVLNDPYRVVEVTDGPDSLYADLQFCTKEDGDSVHITPMCDTFTELGVDGDFTTDVQSLPGGPAGRWRGSPSVKGSSTHFNQSSILTASGGFTTAGGKLGPGTAVLYPNFRGKTGAAPTSGRMGVNQDFTLRLEDVTPREEDFDIPNQWDDNTPPTSADPTTDPNPDAAPTGNGNGAVAYTLEDYAGTASRLGPWGGLSALGGQSLLAGGGQLNGSEFLLNGGGQIPSPTATTGYIRAAN